MPSIPPVKTKLLIRKLRQLGFEVDDSKGKGSHVKLIGKNGDFMIIPKSLESKNTRSTIAKFLIKEGVNLDTLFS
ncbi:hypothetical protein HOC67_02940 [Candidatus Peregrinibacteria bacterium]|jgi:predicted RNA binding protein YcfA (HicA-like mRNA interferase family)|nr:hypothetical protein [Candidatus Peregrinibacteria bacterium]